MTGLYLDSSAWVKLYFAEQGSDWVRQLWGSAGAMACSDLGRIEVLSAIARRAPAAGRDPKESFEAAEADSQSLYRVGLDEAVLDIAQRVAKAHALRGSDAIHLASAVSFQRTSQSPVVLVASDAELLTAAAAEGFQTLDPQANPPLPQP